MLEGQGIALGKSLLGGGARRERERERERESPVAEQKTEARRDKICCQGSLWQKTHFHCICKTEIHSPLLKRLTYSAKVNFTTACFQI
jgi:hypothetical protein